MPQIKLLSLNIEGDNHLDKVVPLLKKNNPDVVLFQEVFESDLATFTVDFGFSFFTPLAIIDQPNAVRLNPKGKWGLLTLLKFKPVIQRAEYYVGSNDTLKSMDFTNINDISRAIQISIIQFEQMQLKFINTHFTWSNHGLVTQEQGTDFSKLSGLLEKEMPFLLSGDFNTPRGSKIYDQLSNKFSNLIPKNIQTTIDPQLHRVKNLQLVVDGLFSSYQVKSAHVQLISGVSDHKAIAASIEI